MSDFLFGSEGSAPSVVDVRSGMDRFLRDSTGQELWKAISDFSGGYSKVPKYEGPFAAAISPGEASTLNQLRNYVSGGGANTVQTAANTLNSMAGGGAFSPLVTGPTGAAGIDLTNRILRGETMDPMQDAMLRSAITTAQRPLLEQFDERLAGATSDFTRAGQFVQPGSSSPFDLAKAKLQTGLAAALGDVATNISYANMTQEKQRQADIIAQQAGAVESGLNRQVTAATAAPGFTRQVLDSLTEALRVEALPRMIEQAGIEGGVNEFNTQRNAFLNLLMAAFGNSAAQPVGLPGSEGGGGILQPLLTAAGTAAGGPVGGALASLFL